MPADDNTSDVAQSTRAQSSPDVVSEVLDVPQVARLLRVGRNTVYALVARNAIPHRRLGKAIRFSRASVMSWLSTSWQGAKEGE
jgi:excisionase family DNA binding protein